MAEPGARVRAVAARHGVCESLLFAWRRQVHDGVLRAPEMPVFMPVQVLGTSLAMPGLSRTEPPPAAAPPALPPALEHLTIVHTIEVHQRPSPALACQLVSRRTGPTSSIPCLALASISRSAST